MRILVTPERLLDLSRQIGQGAAQLRELEGRLGRALAGLDWEVRQQANVEGLVYDARNRARALAERAEGLARFLADRAHAFQKADQEASNDWDAFLAPFRTPVSTPVLTTLLITPVLGPLAPFALVTVGGLAIGSVVGSTISSIIPPEAIPALAQPAALAWLVGKIKKIDASGVAHVFGPHWLKESAGVSPYLTHIRPENLAKHLVRQELFRVNTSLFANFMTVVGLIPTAIKDWQEYSGKGFAAFAGAFLVDAAIDIVVIKACQLGGAALGAALGTALIPVLGPLAPAVGSAVGSFIGTMAGVYVSNRAKKTTFRYKAVEIMTEAVEVTGDSVLGAALGAALGAPLFPVLGPLAPAVGSGIGWVVGGKQIVGFLRETADGIQRALSGIFNKVIVPVE